VGTLDYQHVANPTTSPIASRDRYSLCACTLKSNHEVPSILGKALPSLKSAPGARRIARSSRDFCVFSCALWCQRPCPTLAEVRLIMQYD
jgi:hypothetical protein